MEIQNCKDFTKNFITNNGTNNYHNSYHPILRTVWSYSQVMCPKDADDIANSVDLDETVMFGAV